MTDALPIVATVQADADSLTGGYVWDKDPVISLRVFGTPVPQARLRHLGRGRPTVYSNQDTLLPWRRQIAAAAHKAMIQARRVNPSLVFPLTCPVAVVWVFTVRKPKSAPKRRRTYPATRPDLNHYVRAAEDGLSSKAPDRAMGQVLVDDAQIVESRELKVYPGEHPWALPEPGASVHVYQILEG